MFKYYKNHQAGIGAISVIIGVALLVTTVAGSLLVNHQGDIESNRLDINHLTGTVADLQEETDLIAGATNKIPDVIALFETTLASSITSTAVTMTLTSATDKDGNTLASSTYAFIIDEGTASEEMVIADCTGTACTNMTRGISVLTGTSTVTALKKAHRRGASVKITDGPQLLILTRLLQGIDGFDNILKYSSAPSFTSGSNQIATVNFAEQQANQGAATSSEAVAGIIEQATAIETASTTQFDANNPHAINSEQATSTPAYGCDGTTTSGALCVVVAENDGKLNQGWIDLTENFDFDGATTTLTGTNPNLGVGTTTPALGSIGRSGVSINGDLWVTGSTTINNIEWLFPSADGTDGQVFKTDGAGGISLTNNGTMLLATSTSSTVTDAGASEQTAFTYSLAGNSLGTGNAVRIKFLITDLDLDHSTSGSAETLTWRFKYGATTMHTLTFDTISNANADNLNGYFEWIINADGATGTQTSRLIFWSMKNVTTPTAGSVLQISNVGSGGASEDSTGALNIAITGQSNTDSGNNIGFTVDQGIVELIN